MANNLDSNVSDIVLKKFLDAFTCNQVLTKTVNTQLLDGQINPDTGEQVRFKRPIQYRSKRTADGDISALTRNNIVSGSAFGRIRDYITVDIEYTQLEQAVKLNQLDEILKPAAMQMVADLETELATYMNQQLALVRGSAGTNVNKWGDVAACGSLMASLGVPMGEMYAVMNPFAVQALADTQSGLASGDNRLVNTAWEKAQISRDFAGLMGLTSNCLSQQTTGDFDFTIATTVSAPPTQTYVSAKDTYTISVALASGVGNANAVITAGTVLEFTAASGDLAFINLKSRQAFPGNTSEPFVKFTAVVTEDATADGAGAVTVTVTAGIWEANGQYNNISQAIATSDVVTSRSGAADATTSPSLFYHKNAIGLGTVKLPKLHSKESRVITEGGFSIRMTMDSDTLANTQFVRFDMLPAFATFNPLFGGRFYGST